MEGMMATSAPELRPADILQLMTDLDGIAEPAEALDMLHALTAPIANVYAAWRVPVFRTEVGTEYEVGKNVFPHCSVSPAYWKDFWPLIRKHGRSPMAQLAMVERHPITLTEGMRILKLTGPERWLFDLFRKHGMRDGCYCPAGRWLIVFWSGKVLHLRPAIRAAIFTAAMQTAFRLDQMVKARKIDDKIPNLTPRELAVLRLLSRGSRPKAIAEMLGIGEETVRTFLKGATRKLKAKSPMHAACQALRQHLIS
jgi:DNA-binding CsgD family transcriptional regulator